LLFRALAQRGNAEAQTKLGHIYSLGEAVTQNYREAVKWYLLAAKQGGVEAQKHYNTIRPHSALNYRPPAPQTFAPLAAHLDEIMPMQ
jgi:TPR repeat protein